MDTRKVRDLSILLPYDDPDARTPLTGLPGRAELRDVTVTGEDWSRLTLDERDIMGSSIAAVNLAEARIEHNRLSNNTFNEVDFASSRWTETKVDRCVFRGCRFMGAQIIDVGSADLIFERCRFDYATFTGLRATGPIAFIDCMMRESIFDTCKLENVAFVECLMSRTQFRECIMRGTDLRGCEINSITGIASMSGVRIEDRQIVQLTNALLADLEIQVE